MKKTLLILFSLLVLTGVSANSLYAYDEYGNLFTHRLYFGIGAMPFEVSGLPNMDITDKRDDLGNTTANPEGRIALNLSNKEASGYHGGVSIGYEFLIANRFGIVGEIGFYSIRQDENSNTETNDKSTLTTGYLGFEYRFISSEFFYMGILPKIGFIRAKLDFGETVNSIYGTPPVWIFENGVHTQTIYSGESIAVTITGFSAQALLTAGIRLGPIEIFAQGGATYAAFGGFDVEIGSTKIPSSSKQLVTPGGYTYANPDPKISSVGAFIQVGAALNF